jgi:hypothetical protein
MNKQPFIRSETLAGVEYEILSSNNISYYTVPMLNGKAMGCECRHAKFNPSCRHQTIAEKQEAIYQRAHKAPSLMETVPLHSAVNSFNLLR